MSKKMFDKKIEKLKNKTKGKLIVKEYPTASAHVGHFRHLLQELDIKKDFKPDIIFIDYLNICASHRIRPSLVQTLTHWLRVLQKNSGVLQWSMMYQLYLQLKLQDQDMVLQTLVLKILLNHLVCSATADLMFALITSDELEELDQLVVKQLKNRYNDPTIFKRFVIGIDRSRMKLYDCEQEAQEELIDSAEEYDDSIPVADRGRDRYSDFKI